MAPRSVDGTLLSAVIDHQTDSRRQSRVFRTPPAFDAGWPRLDRGIESATEMLPSLEKGVSVKTVCMQASFITTHLRMTGIVLLTHLY